MTSKQVNTLFEALDNVRDSFKCAFCSEICRKPVTLRSCFHLICEEHLEVIEQCPTCNTPVIKDSPVYREDDLEACVDSVKELDKIFAPFRTNFNEALQSSTVDKPVTKKKGKKKSVLFKDIDQNKSSPQKRTADKRITRSDNVNSSVQPVASTSKANTKPVDKRNVKSETALQVACRLGVTKKIKELLDMGADPNTQDNAGWTPLHEVVRNGRLDLVKLLLQHHTLINVTGPGNETALHVAVRKNYKHIVKELVTHGGELHVRNGKGETPMQIASGEMKKIMEVAAENVIQSQTANVLLISQRKSDLDLNEIRIFSVSQLRTVHNKLRVLVKSHSNVFTEAGFSKIITHLIVDTDDDLICTPSLDILQGIVSGVWILTSAWVMKCTKEKLEPLHDYEVVGVGTELHNGPRNSRYNKYRQLPGLFNGCHFYLHNFSTNYEMTKALVFNETVLTKLITDAGGVVLTKEPDPELIPEAERLVPYHARKGGRLERCSHYIIFKDIYEPMYDMKHFKALPIWWLVECIKKYELIDPE